MLQKLKAPALFVLLICFTGLSVFLYSLFYIRSYALVDTKTKSDAIVILGTSAGKNGDNPCLVAHVKHGLDLYNQGYARKIILSGGLNSQDQMVEANSMAKIAHNLGVSNDLILENKSTSTYEKLLFTKKIMHSENLTTAIIVTDPYHSPRASLTANSLDISHTVSPAANSPCWNDSPLNYFLLRDAAGLILYKLAGKI